MAMTISGDNGLTFPAGSTQVQAGNYQTMVNRIINGRMEIDQRNAGASVTPSSSAYTLDRWRIITSPGSKFSFQQSSTVPAGFNNSVICTSTSAYSAASGDVFRFTQFIEGFNVADLGWGTANAQTVTLSFWVRSSLTGTFAVAINNENSDRSYVATYTISSANTFEYKTITITGDTTGTWPKTNGIGMGINFDLGSGSSSNTTANAWQAGNFSRTSGSTSVVGTNGATFYITGVDLRVGSYTVVPQDFRAYGTELALCQRYYFKNSGRVVTAKARESDRFREATFFIKTTMRATPTITIASTQGGGTWNAYGIGADSCQIEVLATADGEICYADSIIASVEL